MRISTDRFLQFALALVAAFAFFTPAHAQSSVGERFFEAISAGQAEVAESMLTGDARLSQYSDIFEAFGPDQMYVMVANTRKMLRFNDADAYAAKPEALELTRYDVRQSYGFRSPDVYPDTRMIVELKVEGEKIAAVHRYWVGPVPPPMPIMRPRGN